MQNTVVLHFLTPALFQAAAWRYLLCNFWKQAIKSGEKLITYSYLVKNTTWQIIYIWTCQLLNINTEQYFVKYISYRQGVVYRTKHHQDLWQLMGRWWKCILSYPRKKKKRKIYLPVTKKASKHIDQRHPDNNNNVFRRLRLLKHLPN